MRFSGRGLALALLLSAVVPLGVMPRGPALAQGSAEQVLLDKANYWRLKDRPDLATDALNKLLAINPNNPEALFVSGELAVQQNKPADAQRYLAKLQEVAPDSQHIADLEAAIRTGKIGPTDLNEARRLAQAGQTEEAVKQYKEVFKGPPPSTYGVEYYMTLAGTPEGWDEARQGLEKLAKDSPNDPQIKLSLAEVYTFREPTRMQGIGMLVQMSKNPVVGANAVKAWKQALTWLGGSKDARAALQQYLAQYPQDTDIQQLLADLKNHPAGGGGTEAQNKAYGALKGGNTAAAERQFAADLRANPNDPSALAGMGLVRLRQQRFTEARDLLARAMRAAPDQQKTLAAAYGSANLWARVDEAKRAAAAGNFAAARGILIPLLAHPHADQWGAQMVLGDVETKAGEFAAAEATYRQVLRERPGYPDAVMGLANALKAQNKAGELAELTSRMSPAEKARFESGGSGGAAERLRNEAKTASANGDVAGATAKFKASIAADPKNPWIRLDYARFLAGQGQLPAAYAVVDPAASGGTPTDVMVSAMFDAQQDRWAQALDKVQAIPPNQRTGDIKNFYERVYTRGTIDKAKAAYAAGRVAEARNMMIALYNDPIVKTDEKREASYVLFHDFHDQQDALRITREAYLSGRGDPVKSGSDYAMLLLIGGHHNAEAAAVMAQLDASGRVTESNREETVPVRIALANRQADALIEKRDYAGAWDQISPLLTDQTTDTGLLIEAGRIYAAAGRHKEALAYFDKAYQQDPDNIDVIRGVVAGCLLAHETGQAQTYLDKGMEADPRNAWLYYLKAQIEEQRGNNGAAIDALRTSRQLDREQNGPAATPDGPTPLTPGAAPPKNPLPNPFRRSQATPMPSPATGRQLAQYREVPQ